MVCYNDSFVVALAGSRIIRHRGDHFRVLSHSEVTTLIIVMLASWLKQHQESRLFPSVCVYRNEILFLYIDGSALEFVFF